MKKLIYIILLFLSSVAFGQEKKEIKESDYTNEKVEMADAMRADGKIYVVVAVMTVILLVLIGYTVAVDRKVTKLEQLVKEDDQNHDG